jgi:endonuclease/exonuclease/phosphatase family metal-dependent hydrolase
MDGSIKPIKMHGEPTVPKDPFCRQHPVPKLMRIGTWNIDNRLPSDLHFAILHQQDCDVWLLTEVNPKWVSRDGRIGAFHCHLSTGVMAREQHWAAVLSRSPMKPQPDPHPASAFAAVDDLNFCSSILPWRGSGGDLPWKGSTHADRTETAISQLLDNLPKVNLVWGGDWNHSMLGAEVAGSKGERHAILLAIDSLEMIVPTAALMHRNNKCNAIDHIAVPKTWVINSTERIDATGFSDHDAYVIEATPP